MEMIPRLPISQSRSKQTFKKKSKTIGKLKADVKMVSERKKLNSKFI